MKKCLSLLLSFVLAFSCCQVFSFAADESSALPFSCTLSVEQQEFAKGEDVKVNITGKNTSLNTITNIRLWLDYPVTDYFLTPGITEHFIDECNDSFNESFRICEDPGVLEFASKFNKNEFINKFLLRLANAYKSLTLLYASVKYDVQNSFIPLNQKKAELGSVKVIYDGTEIELTVKCRYSVKKSVKNEMTKLSNDCGMASSDIKAVENSYTGIAFAVKDSENYGLFAINPGFGKAFVYRVEGGKFNLVGTKTVNIVAGKYYLMKVAFSDNRMLGYVIDNPSDSEPYPAFDIEYSSDANGYGTYVSDGGCENFSVTPYEFPLYGKTYVNPVYGNSADPFILSDNGTYYLYATTNPGDGYSVSVSTDLVNWQSLGYCARKGDIIGSGNFWAPEVYKYNGKYYMLYSTDEHLALATASLPTGPFVKTSDNYLLEDKCIDGHLFFDDDGSVYLYMAYWGKTGEEIRGCKMTDDLTVIEGTLTQLTSCREDEGGVNEGPAMLKYKGMYYLTYSINGYTEQTYAVRLAVSDSPLGSFVEKGSILEKSGSVVGTGHHCFTTSPNGEELIIAYHCHCSTSAIHPRKLCIDRCRFVETEDGYTISVYGPTSTAQPYPD